MGTRAAQGATLRAPCHHLRFGIAQYLSQCARPMFFYIRLGKCCTYPLLLSACYLSLSVIIRVSSAAMGASNAMSSVSSAAFIAHNA